MEEQTLQQMEEPITDQKNPIDEAYLKKIADLEKKIENQQKDLDRANAAFKNLLENRQESVANDSTDGVLENIKRLIKH